MKVDFSSRVTDALGRVVEDGNLGWVCAFALATVAGNLTPTERFSRGCLAMRLAHADGLVTVTAEDIAAIKAAVGEAFLPGVVAPIWRALEGDDELAGKRSACAASSPAADRPGAPNGAPANPMPEAA